MKQKIFEFFEGDAGRTLVGVLILYAIFAVFMYAAVFLPKRNKAGDRYERFCLLCDDITYAKEGRRYYVKRHLVPAIALVADVILYLLVFCSESFEDIADTLLTAAFIISGILLIYYIIVFFFIDGGWFAFSSSTSVMHEKYRDAEYVTENEYEKWDDEPDSAYTLKSSRTYDKNAGHNAFAFFMNLIWFVLKIALAIGYAAAHMVYNFIMTLWKLIVDRFLTHAKRIKAKTLFREYLCTTVAEDAENHGMFVYPFFKAEYVLMNELSGEAINELMLSSRRKVESGKGEFWLCAPYGEGAAVIAYVNKRICNHQAREGAATYIYEGRYGKIFVALVTDEGDPSYVPTLSIAMPMPDQPSRSFCQRLIEEPELSDQYRFMAYSWLKHYSQTQKPNTVVTAWAFSVDGAPVPVRAKLKDIKFNDAAGTYAITKAEEMTPGSKTKKKSTPAWVGVLILLVALVIYVGIVLFGKYL